MRRRPLAGLGALAITALAIIATPLSASADTPMGHDGMNGVHGLIDSTEYPGAICRYDGPTLDGIRVRAPIVYGLDLSEGVDRTTVGWRAFVDAREGTGPWQRVATSPIQFAQQTRDDQPARFTARLVPVESEDGKNYRVLVRMFWYFDEKALTLVGHATHRVDRYRVLSHIGGVCSTPIVP